MKCSNRVVGVAKSAENTCVGFLVDFYCGIRQTADFNFIAQLQFSFICIIKSSLRHVHSLVSHLSTRKPAVACVLPNFWMKLVRPTEDQPANVVTFAVSTEMTKHDVKNYLEKIYKVPVIDVRTRIALGETKRDQVYGYVTKKDDVKLAYVTMVSSGSC